MNATPLAGDRFDPAEAAACIRVPSTSDDKYSRGVLGVVTGSDRYPGAAVLTVEAAMRTGVGSVRYLGPPRATDLVLQRRPEAISAAGRVQAWLLGSGTDADGAQDAGRTDREDRALADSVPLVLDAGALPLAERSDAPRVLTPHAGELSRLLDTSADEVRAAPVEHARRAADRLGATVLLKGHRTHVVTPAGAVLVVSEAPTWLATAGAGDALAGILGALVATHSDEVLADPERLGSLAATAAVLHGLAAQRASGGGPFTVLDLCAQLGPTIAELVRERP